MPALKHIHTYIFLETRNGVEYYKCDDAYCTHFTTKQKILNKASICSKCREKEVIISYKQLHERKNPLCLNCQNTKTAKSFKMNKQLIENLLGDSS